MTGACTPGPQSPSIRAVRIERLRADEQSEQGRASAAEDSIASQGPVRAGPAATSALCLRHGLPQGYTG